MQSAWHGGAEGSIAVGAVLVQDVGFGDFGLKSLLGFTVLLRGLGGWFVPTEL